MKQKPVLISELVTPKDFFSEMVSTAISKRNLKVYPAVQDYLVSLLEHYLDAKNLFDSEMTEEGLKKTPDTLAEMYLRASNSEHTTRVALLKKLGDRSLYISGFFADSLQRKIVDVDYYAEMGGAAYGALSEYTKEDNYSAIFKVFSSRFLEFVEVLNIISEESFIKSDQSILRLYDKYMRTGSELAKEKLIEMGVITLPLENAKLIKQN